MNLLTMAQTEVQNVGLFPYSMGVHIGFCCIALIFFIYRFITQKKPFQLIMAIAIPFSLIIHLSESRKLFHFVFFAETFFILLALVSSIVYNAKHKNDKPDKPEKKAEESNSDDEDEEEVPETVDEAPVAEIEEHSSEEITAVPAEEKAVEAPVAEEENLDFAEVVSETPAVEEEDLDFTEVVSETPAVEEEDLDFTEVVSEAPAVEEEDLDAEVPETEEENKADENSGMTILPNSQVFDEEGAEEL